MKFSVCIDALFPAGGQRWKEVNVYDRVALAVKHGARAVEFWSWWDKDLGLLEKARKDLGVVYGAFCTRQEGLVAESTREKYLAGLRESVAVAKRLGCETLIATTGDEIIGIPREIQHRNIADGLRLCAPILEESGITLVLEPLNTLVNHAGYYLWSSDEAAEILDEVGSPNVKMLFDIYHQQIMEGNIIARLTKYAGKLGHIHCAGVPGRHELNSGELDYGNIFAELDALGYDRYIGLELFTDEPEKELGRLLGK